MYTVEEKKPPIQDKPKPIEIDFTKINLQKPVTEEMPTQKVVKIEFKAVNPYGTSKYTFDFSPIVLNQ